MNECNTNNNNNNRADDEWISTITKATMMTTPASASASITMRTIMRMRTSRTTRSSYS
ncbi:MAG: hypothetical protein ACI8RD_003692, partial [Bacillariaceae sp.]